MEFLTGTSTRSTPTGRYSPRCANPFFKVTAARVTASPARPRTRLDGHLKGGIPDRDIYALNPYWAVFPALRESLFQGNGRAGYSESRIETQQVKAAILSHGEFKSYQEQVSAIFDIWRKTHEPFLRGLDVNSPPKSVIHTLSEDLLARFADLPLLERYDVYQQLTDYWDEVMQDDVYLIAADGWVEAAKPRGIIEDKEKKIKETPDLTIKRKKYKVDLIPPPLVVARYFAAQQAAIEVLQVNYETTVREREEFVEEHTGEDSLLEDTVNDDGKINKVGMKNRLKAISDDDDPESGEERKVLTRCIALIEAESEAAKAVKEARAALDQQVLARYATLTKDEVKTLMVEDKWFASIRAEIEGEEQRLTQQLAGRVKELEDRYAKPLPMLEEEVAALSEKVDGHLKKMGLSL